MGTINYGYNNYFMMGINPYKYIDEYEKETDINFLWDEINNTLKKYKFEYFTVTLEPGYYEGMYINIDFDFLWLYNYQEKLIVLKETTQLKLFLLECCKWGFVQYSPGWVTGYYSEEETTMNIKQAIKEIKQNIKNFPTYYTYRKGA